MTTGASACNGRLNSGDAGAGNLDAVPLVLHVIGPAAEVDAAVRKLRAAGALASGPGGPEPADADDWRYWMGESLGGMFGSDGVALLPGAGGSRSAAIHCRLAHDLAIPVRTVPGWLTQLGQNDYMGRLLGGRP